MAWIIFYILVQLYYFWYFWIHALCTESENDLFSLEKGVVNENLKEKVIQQIQSDINEPFSKEKVVTAVFGPTKKIIKLSTKQELLDNLTKQQKALHGSILASSPILYDQPLVTPAKFFFKQNELLNLPDHYLVELIERTLVGPYKVKNSQCPWLVLNPVILDLEASEAQLLVGFYFASINTFVQFVLDVRDSKNVKQKFHQILFCFFSKLSMLSNSFEKNWLSYLNNSVSELKFTFLSGFNINNFDIPVLACYLTENFETKDLVVETCKKARNLLLLKDRKDFSDYPSCMKDLLFVDVFWWCRGRLNTWVDILNDSRQFKRLQKKRWRKRSDLYYDEFQMFEWASYNRNDLLSSHVLGLFRNTYFEIVVLRLVYAKRIGIEMSLVEIFQDRYLI